ncbi:MAG: exodeoxyribonuclease VII large subunit [Candidatus Pacebacteria bacterium]|nr:exodeoxyribonuclease VII large subunit [Candidatus Paceibacterota bacterium]
MSIEQKIWTVSEFNNTVKQILENSFSDLIWVQGEIIGFDKQKNRKHIYFQLQEKDPVQEQVMSEISVIIFEGDKPKLREKLLAANVGAAFRDGAEVRVLCKVNVYSPRGQYGLIIKDIDTEFSLGKLAQAKEEIIKYLKDKELLDRNKKVPLALVPLSIGLITQVDTEGYNDFISKLQESNYSFQVSFYASFMQGQKVEQQICSGLDYFNNQKKVDIIVITRGGGAKTDLSWFDNKKIAEKIAFSEIPVLTGIGHKTDYSITDMVAFSSQQTPSSAAVFLVDRVKDFLENINQVADDIVYSSENYLRFILEKLTETKTYLARESLLFLQVHKNRIQTIQENIVSNCKHFFKQAIEIINNYKSSIYFLDPIKTLQRGFSITKMNGKTIKSIKMVKKGQDISTTVSDGEIKSNIININYKN